MSTAMLKQQTIQSTLRKADGDIRKFATCLENAKMSTHIDGEQDCLEELQTLANKLQEYRNQVRTWSTQSSKHALKKRELADMRERIEHEIKKFGEFKNGIDVRPSPRLPPIRAAPRARYIQRSHSTA